MIAYGIDIDVRLMIAEGGIFNRRFSVIDSVRDYIIHPRTHYT